MVYVCVCVHRSELSELRTADRAVRQYSKYGLSVNTTLSQHCLTSGSIFGSPTARCDMVYRLVPSSDESWEERQFVISEWYIPVDTGTDTDKVVHMEGRKLSTEEEGYLFNNALVQTVVPMCRNLAVSDNGCLCVSVC
jgi:hypothetical protein